MESIDEDEREFLRQQELIVTGEIAHGAFGMILKVYSIHYKQEFALKRIPLQHFDQNEIDCTRAIDNLRVVNLYRFFSFKNLYYLMMEICTNDLERIVRDGPKLTRDDLFKYTSGVIQSIKACHDANIAHCDIKPSNFMIDAYGRVKVGDFGLATNVLKEISFDKMRGTRYFMSPEMIMSKEYDLMKADVWAVGVTLYYIATGSLPFWAKDQDSLFSIICKGLYRIDKVSEPLLRQVIIKCLETNPVQRCSIADLLELPYFKKTSTTNTDKVLVNTASKIIKPRLNSRQIKKYRSGVFTEETKPIVVSYLAMCKSSGDVVLIQ